MIPIMRELIIPKTEQEWLSLRLEDITSTEVSSLFNLSPYMTEFELWHRKKNKEIVTIEANDRMKWGTRLQNSIGAGIAQDNGWTVRRMDEYIRIPELRIGSSFDFSIEQILTAQGKPITKEDLFGHSEEMKDKIMEEEKIPSGLLEIKNVDSLAFRNGWIVDGDNIEAPTHIELQVQHQLLVSGRKFAFIGALVGGNSVHLIRREPDPKIISEIERRVKLFWQSIESNQPPKPDFSRDIETISRIYGYAEPGKVFDASGNSKLSELISIYRKAGEEEKEAGKRKEAAKGEMLMMIGDAEKVIGDEFKISLGVVGPCHVEYDKKGYRMFKPTWSKNETNKIKVKA
jgi:predicted phage-related endonuclease